MAILDGNDPQADAPLLDRPALVREIRTLADMLALDGGAPRGDTARQAQAIIATIFPAYYIGDPAMEQTVGHALHVVLDMCQAISHASGAFEGPAGRRTRMLEWRGAPGFFVCMIGRWWRNPNPVPDPSRVRLAADRLESLWGCAETSCEPGGNTANKSVDPADNGADDPPAADIAEQPSLEARALAMLTDHPDWTDTRIAQVLQCNRGSLYRLDKFKAARDLLKRDGVASEDRGSKADGRIEAWESNE